MRALLGLAHDAGRAGPMMPRAERLSPSVSRRGLVLIAVGLLILIGIVIVAVAREATSRRVVAAALSRPAAPARPPLTPAEETYIQALWPIHGAVERSAVRMSLGQIFYVTKDVGRTELKARVDDLRGRPRRPPASRVAAGSGGLRQDPRDRRQVLAR